VSDPLVTPFQQANFYRNDWQLHFEVMTLSPEPYAGTLSICINLQIAQCDQKQRRPK
jgi:hypothetical protein